LIAKIKKRPSLAALFTEAHAIVLDREDQKAAIQGRTFH